MLTVSVSDEGFTGTGGPKSASLNIPLEVLAQNVGPVIIAPPAPLVTNEGQAISLEIGVNDVDAGATPGGEIEVEVWTGHGAQLKVEMVQSFVSDHVNQVQTVIVGVPLPVGWNTTTGYVPALNGSFILALDLGELVTGVPSASLNLTGLINANAVAKVCRLCLQWFTPFLKCCVVFLL